MIQTKEDNYFKAYYAKNKEACNKKTKEWTEKKVKEDPDYFKKTNARYKTYRTKYYLENKEACNKKTRLHYLQNKEQTRAAKRKNYKKNRDIASAIFIRAYLNKIKVDGKQHTIGKYFKLCPKTELDYSISLKRLIFLYKYIYIKQVNVKENKQQMKAEIIKANKLKESISSNILKMGELGDIIIGALISFEEGELTTSQMKMYMNSTNTAHKVLFSKFIMEQALVQQFPEEEITEEETKEITE